MSEWELGTDPSTWPTVSVVMPIRNEAENLERAVTAVLAQEYPRPFDVCLAVAPSDDGSETLARRIAAEHDRVAVVANPAGSTPAGLNAAIRATNGSIVVRVDGHAELSPGYIRQAIETMCRTGAVNVGGSQIPKPDNPFEHAVAAATRSWIGTGGATYRVGVKAGPVDTVYLGVFDRAAGDAVEWFDESLIRNQDYELNIRLRGAGGKVWFDPELWVGYRPRSTWTALAKQYYHYGWWKAEVLRRHPGTLRVRQLVPAALAPILSVSALVGLRRRTALIVPLAYAVLIAIAGATTAPLRRPNTAVVLATIHLTWSAGFASRTIGAAVDLVRRSVGARDA